MRELIEAVRAEAEAVIRAQDENDRYHKEQLQENEVRRRNAKQRMRDCDEALEAIDGAAKHLAGRK